MTIQGAPFCKQSGFTTVELIAIIVLLGIVSVFVTSRFSSTGSFAERTVRDRLIGIARYAQQRAMYDQNSASCYRLHIDASEYGAQRSTGGGAFSYFGPANTDSENPANVTDGRIQMAKDVTIDNAPIDIYFDGLGNALDNCNGSPLTALITIRGADLTQQVVVEGTGYVHWQ